MVCLDGTSRCECVPLIKHVLSRQFCNLAQWLMKHGRCGGISVSKVEVLGFSLVHNGKSFVHAEIYLVRWIRFDGRVGFFSIQGPGFDEVQMAVLLRPAVLLNNGLFCFHFLSRLVYKTRIMPASFSSCLTRVRPPI